MDPYEIGGIEPVFERGESFLIEIISAFDVNAYIVPLGLKAQNAIRGDSKILALRPDPEVARSLIADIQILLELRDRFLKLGVPVAPST